MKLSRWESTCVKIGAADSTQRNAPWMHLHKSLRNYLLPEFALSRQLSRNIYPASATPPRQLLRDFCTPNLTIPMRENHQNLRCLFITLFAFTAPIFVAAQTSAPAAQTSSNGKPDEVVELSPFVVNSQESESGYKSDVTTSGSRLKTNLQEVAASVSVLTSDFMNDLAADNIASAMAFVGGAETDATTHSDAVSALGSTTGYTGGDFGDSNNRTDYIRVRGLGKASLTQNFIEVLASTDRYNTDRSEFLRGANSILFGLAEPAGLVNSSTKVANLKRNLNNIETKFDNFGSQRYVLDISRALIRNKLAFRAIGLTRNQQYKVKTAYQKDQRMFLTATYRPFKNTTVTAFYERQDGRGRRPTYRTVQDNASEWLNAYNTYAPNMTQAQIDAAFFWNPLTQTNTTMPSSTGIAADLSSVNLGSIRRPLDVNNRATTLIYNGISNGDVEWIDPYRNLVTLAATRTVTGANGSPLRQFARSASSLENRTLYVDPQVTDSGIFPYDTVEIAALPGAYRSENAHKRYINLDQRITENLYVSASFQSEHWKQEQYFPILSQTNQISIDITKYLPDQSGQATPTPNPNFLRPFIYGRNIGETNDKTLNSTVIQANYDFDFAKKTKNLGWLGLHRLTGVYTNAKQESLGYRWNYQWDNDVPVGLTAANYSQNNNSNRWIMQMWYIGDAVQLGDTSLRITGFPETTSAQWDRSYDYLFFKNTPAPAAWQLASAQIHAGRVLIPAVRNLLIQTNEGYGASMQSYFLKNRLVTLLGWRRDTADSFQGIPLDGTPANFPIVPGASKADYPTGTSGAIGGVTTTQSAVFKINDNLRVFATRSGNFAANPPRQDNLYRVLPPASGSTQEFGLGMTMLKGKLDVRFTHFKSSQENANSNSSVASLRIPDFEDRLYNALSAVGRTSEWETVARGGGTTTSQYSIPSNVSATGDYVSSGDSIEINFSPNRNWDFAASFDRLENINTRVGSEVMDFLDARAPFYKKYFDEGLTLSGSSTTVQTQFINSIAANYVNELIAKGTPNRGVSEYSAKMVARYKFTNGALKGLSIGTNLRWESGKIIGFGTQSSIFNFGGLENYSGTVYDPNIPYRGQAVIAGGMMVSYQRKIFNNKINWRVQLNAQNLFSDTGLRVFAANPDGTPVWAVNPEHVYELSNSFSF